MKTVNLNIRINEDMRDKFKEIAEENTQNPSALVRKWIEKYIKENKEENKMKLEELKEMVADNIVLTEENGVYYADVVEENFDEDRLAQADNVDDLHQQLKDFGQIK